MGAKLTTLMYSVRTSTLGGLFTQKRGRVEFKNVKLGPRITYAQGTCWANYWMARVYLSYITCIWVLTVRSVGTRCRVHDHMLEHTRLRSACNSQAVAPSKFEFNRQDLMTKLNLAWNSIMTRLLRSLTLALTSAFTSQSYVKANLEAGRKRSELNHTWRWWFYSTIPGKESALPILFGHTPTYGSIQAYKVFILNLGAFCIESTSVRTQWRSTRHQWQ